MPKPFNVFLRIWVSFLFFRVGHFENGETCSSDGVPCETDEANDSASILSEIRNGHNQFLKEVDAALGSYAETNCTSCECFEDTIRDDLKPFKGGITEEMINGIRSKGTTYVIYENSLYRDKDCFFPARCSGIEYFLLKLLPKARNTEMIVNTRDWPQISKHFPAFGPVFSFSKTNDYFDIMYPAWSFWEGGPAITTYPRGLGRWDLHRKTLIDEGKKWPWESKKPLGFFRGSRTSDIRDNLVLLSRKRPDVVDAQYTKNQAWKSSADTLGAEPASVVSLEHHCQYKYLFNFRGVAASFRFKHLFLCGSLVIHVGDEWMEFFYPALKPWVHYVPLPDNFSEEDVLKLMTFLRDHDDVARGIADRGRKYITEHLGMKEVKCYWRKLLKRYGKLLKYSPKPGESLIEIK